MSVGFEQMWEAIHEARAERQDVREFRVSAETRRDLIRAIESRQVMSSSPGVEVVFGIPVVVDPRMPDGILIAIRDVDPVIPFEYGGPVLGVGQVFFAPDESHGMTLDELIPEVIEEWNRIRDDEERVG